MTFSDALTAVKWGATALHHGEDAPIQAGMRADAELDKGDVDGYAVWKRVLKAVGALLSKERPDGAALQ